jgi:4-amino-4-deoxy-L-arabinose transferase-like glycosyltransferase
MLVSKLLMKDRSWYLLLALILIVLLTSAVKWMLDHPYAVSWDEALYFNTVLADQSALRDSGLNGLRLEILYSDRVHPPAFRLLAVPFYVTLGFSPLKLRLVSLGFHWLGLVFLYLTTRKIASPKCAVLSVLICCLSPDVLFSSVVFYTEYPLFLATTASFYFLVSSIESKSDVPRNWIGLGLSIGLGLLAKTSFALVVAPVMVVALVGGRIRALSGARPSFAIKASALGTLVAGPWWWKNAGVALGYARYSRNFIYESLGAPSFATWISWILSVTQSLLGHGVTIAITLVVLAWIWKRFVRRDTSLDPVQRTVLLVCVCAILPLVLLQLTGTNHNLRHLCATVVPLAIAVGLLAHIVGWSRSPTLLAISSLAFLAQLLMLVAPVYYPNTTAIGTGLVNGRLPWRALARFDQWDWNALREIGRASGFEEPKISFVGGGRNLNPAQIRYVWAVAGKLNTKASMLWRYDLGTIDWDRVMGSLDESDMVLTAPSYTDTEENPSKPLLDNQHNAEFENRLTRDSHFRGPIRVWMGRFEPVEVEVFLRIR